MPLRSEDKAGGRLKTFGVPSSRGGKGVHEVIKWRATGAWSCDCTDWIIRQAKHDDHSERTGHHCRHVKDCIAGRVGQAGTVYVVPPQPRAEGRAAPVFEGEAV